MPEPDMLKAGGLRGAIMSTGVRLPPMGEWRGVSKEFLFSMTITRLLALAVAVLPFCANAAPFERLWSSTAAYGTGLAETGLLHADLDGDGRNEMIFGGSVRVPYHVDDGTNDIWSVQRFDPVSKRHELRWQSLPYDVGITTLQVLPGPGGVGHRIYVACRDGHLEVFDGASLQLLQATEVGVAVRAIAAADADNDGDEDLVLLTDSSTRLLAPDNLAPQRTIPYGGTSFAIGNVDTNALLEVVYNTGRVVRQTEAVTQLVWDNSAQGFGRSVALENIDGDGRAEIIAAWHLYWIRAFDAVTRTHQWEYRAASYIDAPRVVDVNGDGVAEVLYGDATTIQGDQMAVHVLRAATGRHLWKIYNPDLGVNDVDVFDADGDGDLDVVWATAGRATSPDFLYVFDAVTRKRKWSSRQVDAPFLGAAAGDVDGDGVPEIVTGSYSSNSDSGDALVSVYGGFTHKLKWQTDPYFLDYTRDGIHDVELVDLDDDNAREIIVASDGSYGATMYVIDGKTRELRGEFWLDSGTVAHSLATGDVDGDGALDLVVGSAMYFNNTTANVYVLDPLTGTIKWRSDSLVAVAPAVYQVGVANVDNDPALEIVVSAERLLIFDGVTHERWTSASAGYRAFDFLRTGDRSLIIAGTVDGTLARIDGVSGAELRLANVCGDPVLGLVRDGSKTYFTCGTRLGIYDGAARAVTWMSEPVDADLGAQSSLTLWRAAGRKHLLMGGATRVTDFVQTPPP